MSAQRSMTLLILCENEVDYFKQNTDVHPDWCQTWLLRDNGLHNVNDSGTGNTLSILNTDSM